MTVYFFQNHYLSRLPCSCHDVMLGLQQMAYKKQRKGQVSSSLLIKCCNKVTVITAITVISLKSHQSKLSPLYVTNMLGFTSCICSKKRLSKLILNKSQCTVWLVGKRQYFPNNACLKTATYCSNFCYFLTFYFSCRDIFKHFSTIPVYGSKYSIFN